MTFIQPNKNKSILNAIIAIFLVAIALGVFGMVALYNATVNLSHNITEAKSELDVVGVLTTKLNDQAITAMGAVDLAALATNNGLVEDEKPQYFRVSQSWPIASHY